MIQLSISDVDTLLDALRRGAARHRSLCMALKPGSFHFGKHVRRAKAMDDLHDRLWLVKSENPRRPIVIEVAVR